MNPFEFISINPLVCHGKPVFKGTRILVANILADLATGASFDEISQEYPVSREQILAALAFGSEMSNFEFEQFEYQNVAVG